MMEADYVLWVFGITAIVMFVHRAISWFVVQRRLVRTYEQELQDVLTNDVYKVKGKFE